MAVKRTNGIDEEFFDCDDEYCSKYSYDSSECIDVDDDCMYPEKIVAGYYAEEPEVVTGIDRSNFTNSDITERLGNYFRFFGKDDMDIIYMYFISKKRQEEIMEILGKSQPAVSYDVTRIRSQIEFVVKIVSSVDDFVLFITDPSNPLKTDDKEMLTLFFYSTSIVKTSRILGINNITCRSHLNTIVNRLLTYGYSDMHHLFKYILSNLNNIKKNAAN